MTVLEQIKNLEQDEMIKFLYAVSEEGFIDRVYSCNKCECSDRCNDSFTCIYSKNFKLQYERFLSDESLDIRSLYDNGSE